MNLERLVLEDEFTTPQARLDYIRSVAQGKGKRRFDIRIASRFDNIVTYLDDLDPIEERQEDLDDFVLYLRKRSLREPVNRFKKKINAAATAVQAYRNRSAGHTGENRISPEFVDIAFGRGDRKTQYQYHGRIDYLSGELARMDNLSLNDLDDLRLVRDRFENNRYLDGKRDDILQEKRVRFVREIGDLIAREEARLYDRTPPVDLTQQILPEMTRTSEYVTQRTNTRSVPIQRQKNRKSKLGRRIRGALKGTLAVAGLALVTTACTAWASYFGKQNPTVAAAMEFANDTRPAPTLVVDDLEGVYLGETPDMATPAVTDSGIELNYLLIGEDKGGKSERYGRADALLVANIHPNDGRINIITVPRDTKVNIPGRSGLTKINHAHAYGGPDLQVAAVERFLGIEINGYARANFDTFRALYDGITGLVPALRSDGVVSTDERTDAEESTVVLNGLRNREFRNAAVGRAHNIGRFASSMAARALDAVDETPALVRSAAIALGTTVLDTNIAGQDVDALVRMLGNDEVDVRLYTVPGKANDWPRRARVSYWLAEDFPGEGSYMERLIRDCDDRDCLLETRTHTPDGTAVASAVPDLETKAKIFRVGDARVVARTYERGDTGILYVNMHDTEDTSVDAGKRTVDKHGGRLVELEYGHHRRIRFKLDGQVYEFEPNGMFTDKGIERSLRMYGQGNYSPDAHAAVSNFAQSFVSEFDIDKAGMLVALHNNTEARFSVDSYRAGDQRRIADAAAVHVAAGQDPDNFFFVTDRMLYDGLSDAGFNVVLQDNANCLDDGSLSVFAGQRGILYANSEAQHGHLGVQVAMLDAVQTPFPYQPKPEFVLAAR